MNPPAADHEDGLATGQPIADFGMRNADLEMKTEDQSWTNHYVSSAWQCHTQTIHCLSALDRSLEASFIDAKSQIPNPKCKTRGRPEGRPYPRLQQAVHGTSGRGLSVKSSYWW